MGSSPNWSPGYIPTAGEWNGAFAAKQDQITYTPLNKAGDTLTGPLITFPASSLAAGFNISPGVAPTSSIVGDLWITGPGLYVDGTPGPTFFGPGQQPGTITNDGAFAGNVGEYFSTTCTGSVGFATIASGATVQVGAALNLTAGDWDVSGVAFFKAAGSGTLITFYVASISLSSSGTGPTGGDATNDVLFAPAYSPFTGPVSVAVGPTRMSLAATTPVYLVANPQYSGPASSVTAWGTLRARRVR